MKRSVILVFFSSFAGALWAQQPTALAIHNARIVPVSGPVIAKGTVVVRDGLIETVGADVNIPADAWVVEGDGLTVYPGLIDCLSTIGLPDEAPAPPNRGPGGGTNVPAPAQPAAPASTTPPARGPEDRPNTYSWRRTADLIKTSDQRQDDSGRERRPVCDSRQRRVRFRLSGFAAGRVRLYPADLSGRRPL